MSQPRSIKHKGLTNPDSVAECLCIVGYTGSDETKALPDLPHVRVMGRERNFIDKDQSHFLGLLDPDPSGQFKLFRIERCAPLLSLCLNRFCPIDVFHEKLCVGIMVTATIPIVGFLLRNPGERVLDGSRGNPKRQARQDRYPNPGAPQM